MCERNLLITSNHSKARLLVDLDISWNKFTPQGMLLLAEALADNRQLKSVNLSWNLLTSSTNSDKHVLTIDDEEENPPPHD